MPKAETVSTDLVIKVLAEHDHSSEGDEWATREWMFWPAEGYRGDAATEFRDIIGRRTESANHRWLRLRCAMLESCPAVTLVLVKSIEDRLSGQ